METNTETSIATDVEVTEADIVFDIMIKDAATTVDRSTKTIHSWVQNEKIRSRKDDRGRVWVNSKEVIEQAKKSPNRKMASVISTVENAGVDKLKNEKSTIDGSTSDRGKKTKTAVSLIAKSYKRLAMKAIERKVNGRKGATVAAIIAEIVEDYLAKEDESTER